MAFSELLAENYIISTHVFSELINTKMSDAEIKIMSTINRWIAEVELHGLGSVKSEIEEFDTSILDEMYVLAKELLLENYEFATKKIEELLKHETISVGILENWPLFKRYRNSDLYVDLKKSNPEIFSRSSFTIDSSDENPVTEMLREVSDEENNLRNGQMESNESVSPQDKELAGIY